MYIPSCRSLTGSSRLILAIDDIAADIEEIPNLVQRTVVTAQIHLRAVQLRKRGLDFARGVGLGGVGRNASGGEGLTPVSRCSISFERMREIPCKYPTP